MLPLIIFILVCTFLVRTARIAALVAESRSHLQKIKMILRDAPRPNTYNGVLVRNYVLKHLDKSYLANPFLNAWLLIFIRIFKPRPDIEKIPANIECDPTSLAAYNECNQVIGEFIVKRHIILRFAFPFLFSKVEKGLKETVIAVDSPSWENHLLFR